MLELESWLQQFADLERAGRQDWQVQQAEQALRIARIRTP